MENKFCQWCSSPKNWLRWLIGAVVIVLVFCAGMAAGRFSTFYRGGFERGGFQQGGFNRSMMRGRGQMRGGWNYNNYNSAPNDSQNISPQDQPISTTTVTTPAPQTK